MSDWKATDVITTTCGSIWLSQEQAHAAGVQSERERIIKLLETTSFIWMGEKQLIQVSRDELIALVKGGNNVE